jgi:hypothetical protein
MREGKAIKVTEQKRGNTKPRDWHMTAFVSLQEVLARSDRKHLLPL